jgi:general stress protein CsbA
MLSILKRVITVNKYIVTALTLRVIIARLSVRVYISTDLTPKRYVYIPPYLYI